MMTFVVHDHEISLLIGLPLLSFHCSCVDTLLAYALSAKRLVLRSSSCAASLHIFYSMF